VGSFFSIKTAALRLKSEPVVYISAVLEAVTANPRAEVKELDALNRKSR
jgi:hypothetical protein